MRRFIASTPTQTTIPEGAKRVCTACYVQFNGAHRSKKLVIIIASLPVSYAEKRRLRLVSSLWRDAVRTLDLVWTSIPHRLPHEQPSRLERQLLRCHACEGHNRWMIQALAAGIQPAPLRRSCAQMQCPPTCRARLNAADLVELYHILPPHGELDARLQAHWENLDRDELTSLLPWFVKCSLTRPALTRVVQPYLNESLHMFYAWLFELRLYWGTEALSKTLFDMLLEEAPTSYRENWLQTYRLVEAVEQILDTRDLERRSDIVATLFGSVGATSVRAPWDPSVQVSGIYVDGITVLLSASRPTIVPFATATGVVRILYKREDVRRDQVTMVVARWINSMTELNIPTYSVLPLSTTHGWIVMLAETTTLYDIRRVHGTTLQNFLMDRAPQATVSEFRETFAATCSAACVLCYVMGVGDRHLSNMLVTQDGRIVHIDFTYILGDDPKLYVRTEMRVTADMIDTLGGKDSPTFHLFRGYCLRAYRILRTAAPFWYTLLRHVGDHERVRHHVLSRLVPGHGDAEADDLIVEVVQRSSSSSWGQTITDTSHAWSTWARSMFPEVPTIFNMDM